MLRKPGKGGLSRKGNRIPVHRQALPLEAKLQRTHTGFTILKYPTSECAVQAFEAFFSLLQNT